MEPIPDTAIMAKNLIENRLWAQGKFSIILLKKHSNEIIPDGILMYPQIMSLFHIREASLIEEENLHREQ